MSSYPELGRWSYFLLAVVAEIMDNCWAQTPPHDGTMSGLNPDSNETTTGSTTFNPDSTEFQITTFDIASIIQDRDSLRQEAHSLRVAVIILGIISAVAVIVIVVVVVWVIIKRRRSGNMETNCMNMLHGAASKRQQGTTTYRSKPVTQNDTMEQKNTATYNGPKTQAKEKVVQNKNLNAYVDNNQSLRARPKAEYEVSESTDDSIYQPVDYKHKAKAEITITDSVYVTSENNQEDYEVVQNDNPSTAHKASGIVPVSDVNSIHLGDSDSQQIYANDDVAPEHSANYAGLNPEDQYSHFYN